MTSFVITFQIVIYFSLLITEDGYVYSAGWGADGQTGLGHCKNTDVFTKVIGDIQGEKITKVSCSGDCVLAINGKYNDCKQWIMPKYL